MDHNTDTLCWLLERAKHHGASAADGLLINSAEVSTAHRLGKPEDIERSESNAIGLRVLCGHKQGVVSSTNFDKDTLEQLAEQAVAIANASTEDEHCKLASKGSLSTQSLDLDLEDDFVPTVDWLKEQSQIAEDAARATPGITNSEGASAYHNHTTVHLATMEKTLLFARHYSKSMFSLSASVLAGSDTNMERDYASSSARHKAKLNDPKQVGKEAAVRTLRRLNPKKAHTGTMPIVFDPRVGRSLLGVFARSISGSAIARGTSFLKNRMGEQIFRADITICDDPLKKRGLASRPFDAEGVTSSPRNLVENGALKSWLLDVRTASKLGLITTGHAARSLTSSPSPSATNLYMQNGSFSPDELVKDITKGIYITETFGMGINTVTGDYSQGASGLMIENGEITSPVSEFTIAGNLIDMFATMTPANDLEFNYATNTPTLRIDAMTVAGEDK